MKSLNFRVNKKGMMRLLPQLFTTQQQFISELVQNGHRAGASKIDIDYDFNTRVLIVSDDGNGFKEESLVAFFTAAADSKWSKDVIEEQDPFGIGAAALFFAGKEACIMSNGYQTHFDTSSIYHKKERTTPEVLDLDFKGSMIGLRLNEKIDDTLLIETINDGLFKGFPIPVFLNGTALKQDCIDGAREDKGWSWCDAPFGRIGMKNIDSILTRFLPLNPNFGLFVQGYQLNESSVYPRMWDIIVHLDNKQYPARVPDRTVLLDTEKSRALEDDIKSFYRDVRISELKNIEESLEPGDFSNKYWAFAIQTDPQLIIRKQLPLPKHSLLQFSDLPFKLMEDERYDKLTPNKETHSLSDNAVFRHDNNAFFLAVDSINDYYCYQSTNDKLALYSYAHFAGLPILKSDILNGHWADDITINLNNQGNELLFAMDVTEVKSPIEKEMSWANDNSGTIVLCDEFTLTPKRMKNNAGKWIDLPPVRVNKGAGIFNGKIYLTPYCSYDSLIRQICCCENYDNDVYTIDDELLSRVTRSFSHIVDLYKNKSPEKLIESIFSSFSSEITTALDLLQDHTFSLNFSPSEKIEGYELKVSKSC